MSLQHIKNQLKKYNIKCEKTGAIQLRFKINDFETLDSKLKNTLKERYSFVSSNGYYYVHHYERYVDEEIAKNWNYEKGKEKCKKN